MSDPKGRTELLISDTLVPDIFITQYAQELTKDALCMYLWLLMSYGDREFTKEDIKSFTVLSESDSEKYAAELISHDLLLTKDNKIFRMTDLKKNEVDSYVKAVVARDNADPSLKLCADEESRNVLAGSINKTFYTGKMSYMFYRLVDKCLYEYGFDPTVVYSLFEEGRDQKMHLKVNAMYDLAQTWSKKGYNTPDKLTAYYDRKSQREKYIALMGRLTRTRINGVDIERIEKWIDKYNTPLELAEYAFRVNADFRSNVNLKHVDDKLTEWYAAGIEEIDKAMAYENERKKENKRKATRTKAKSNANKTWAELVSAEGDKAKEQKVDKDSSKEAEKADKKDTNIDNKEVKETKKSAKKPEPAPAEEEADDTDIPEKDDILDLFGGVNEDN